MNISIIITAENKEKYIIRTLKSCLSQNYKNYEIILVYSKMYNESFLKTKFKKKIIFLKTKKKKSPIHDQIYKIKKGLSISKGKYICLLDGDDTIENNKLIKIVKNIKSATVIIDRCKTLSLRENQKKLFANSKKNVLYKAFINPWPRNICTSTICIEKLRFINFFKKIDYSKYKFLAIDVLLVLYFNKKIKYIEDTLTTKYNYQENLDRKFTGFLNWKYWQRRKEQFRYYESLSTLNRFKTIFSLDKFLTYSMCAIIKR